MKETKEARKERQAQEIWRFLDVLRRAGNIVEEEVLVPNLEGNAWRLDYLILDVLTHKSLAMRMPIAVEVQGFGLSHVGRAGWHRDIYKAQAIASNGWLYMPVTWEQIGNGDALEMVSRCGVSLEPAKAVESEAP